MGRGTKPRRSMGEKVKQAADSELWNSRPLSMMGCVWWIAVQPGQRRLKPRRMRTPPRVAMAFLFS